MSGGPVCKCQPRRLWVIQYLCHHSAFAGYHKTWSDYSSVVCRTCGAVWRTKAFYVQLFPLAPDDWHSRVPDHGKG